MGRFKTKEQRTQKLMRREAKAMPDEPLIHAKGFRQTKHNAHKNKELISKLQTAKQSQLRQKV